jgi:hypothetical protein
VMPLPGHAAFAFSMLQPLKEVQWHGIANKSGHGIVS